MKKISRKFSKAGIIVLVIGFLIAVLTNVFKDEDYHKEIQKNRNVSYYASPSDVDPPK